MPSVRLTDQKACSGTDVWGQMGAMFVSGAKEYPAVSIACASRRSEREAGQVTRGIGWSDGGCLSRCYLQSAGWRRGGRRRLSASGRVVIAAGAS